MDKETSFAILGQGAYGKHKLCPKLAQVHPCCRLSIYCLPEANLYSIEGALGVLRTQCLLRMLQSVPLRRRVVHLLLLRKPLLKYFDDD